LCKSVKGSGITGGCWAKGYWAKGVWAKGIWGENLIVLLDGESARQFGDKICAIDLAKEIMEFWRKLEPEFT
jgi:hypothetical protein